jgi:phosphomannomutase
MLMLDKEHFNEETLKNIKVWLDEDFDEDTKSELRKNIEKNPKSVSDAFYSHLSFGTGGMRGLVGVGCNRINVYTIRFATQGLANYVKRQCKGKLAVAISYDSRRQSKLFAKEAAKVLAGNKIHAYLVKELRPTPLLSFAVRQYSCKAGIMITASHNPPDYNGYKVYWGDGGQVLAPHDHGIINEVVKIHSPSKVQIAELDSEYVHLVGEELDAAYYEAITPLQFHPEVNAAEGKELGVVFSNLHGTGITLVPETLKRWGFTSLSHVEEQKEPDGNFPTVVSPNPEERSALELGIKQMLPDESADILLATDPDADRVGIAVKHKGEAILLSGNDVACICLEHICRSLWDANQMPSKPTCVKSIVTTELYQAIASCYSVKTVNVLTGFKYIAEQMLKWEKEEHPHSFLFGAEESYGYLLGTHARDKDAPISCALICEAALQAKKAGLTLVDKMHELYKKHGVFRDKLRSIKYPETQAGKEQMQEAMIRIRERPPRELGGREVSRIEDYQSSVAVTISSGKKEPIDLAKSNVLTFHLDDGSKLVVRPSGTEPKVKIYCGAVLKDFSSSLEEGITACDARAETLLDEVEAFLTQS